MSDSKFKVLVLKGIVVIIYAVVKNTSHPYTDSVIEEIREFVTK